MFYFKHRQQLTLPLALFDGIGAFTSVLYVSSALGRGQVSGFHWPLTFTRPTICYHFHRFPQLWIWFQRGNTHPVYPPYCFTCLGRCGSLVPLLCLWVAFLFSYWLMSGYMGKGGSAVAVTPTSLFTLQRELSDVPNPHAAWSNPLTTFSLSLCSTLSTIYLSRSLLNLLLHIEVTR